MSAYRVLLTQYGKVRDLALRATHWQQLYDPVLPGFFLAWAKRNDIDYPAELENQVVARGHQIADWKSLYDGLQAQYNELKAQHDAAAAKVQAVLDEDKNLIDGLAAERELTPLARRATRAGPRARASRKTAADEGTRHRLEADYRHGRRGILI